MVCTAGSVQVLRTSVDRDPEQDRGKFVRQSLWPSLVMRSSFAGYNIKENQMVQIVDLKLTMSSVGDFRIKGVGFSREQSRANPVYLLELMCGWDLMISG